MAGQDGTSYHALSLVSLFVAPCQGWGRGFESRRPLQRKSRSRRCEGVGAENPIQRLNLDFLVATDRKCNRRLLLALSFCGW